MPATSKAQQRFMGMVRAAQKGEMKPSGAVAKAAKSMTKTAAKDFASTKHKGLPEKIKEGEVKGEPLPFSYVLRPSSPDDNPSDLVFRTNIIEFSKDYADRKFENDLGAFGRIYGYYENHTDAEDVANELVSELYESARTLEEKKAQVTDALQKKIDELQKKAEEHLKLAKKEPEKAQKHRDQAEDILARIKVLTKKHQTVEKSKKELTEKKEIKK